MAILLDTGFYFCRACERDELAREDFYNDKHKAHGLSTLCRMCEGERTREAKHQHYDDMELLSIARSYLYHYNED